MPLLRGLMSEPRKWVPASRGPGTESHLASPGEIILGLVRPVGQDITSSREEPQPLSIDEFALVFEPPEAQMEARGDASRGADRHNVETFQCNAPPGGGAWDVELMLGAKPSSMFQRAANWEPEEDVSSNVCIWPNIAVGTCGFMDLSTRSYAGSFRCVELNFTFHDGMAGKDLGPRIYGKKAKELKMLDVKVVVKVSGHATHEKRLLNPDGWWPWLWERYKAFAKAGLLSALLWQFPPSCECNESMLERMVTLAKCLRSSGCKAPSVLEFRHPSWFQRQDVEVTCKKLSFSMAWVHFRNETGWAGEMPSGWSPRFPVQTGPLVYLRLFGAEGRNLGEYDEDFLRDQVMARLPKPQERTIRGFVFFGQSDIPTQAHANAARIASMLQGRRAKDAEVRQLRQPNAGAWLAGSPVAGDVVHGRVVRLERSQALLQLDGGHTAILGTFHVKTRGLKLCRGAELSGLRVEGLDEKGRVRVSSQQVQIADVKPETEAKAVEHIATCMGYVEIIRDGDVLEDSPNSAPSTQQFSQAISNDKVTSVHKPSVGRPKNRDRRIQNMLWKPKIQG